MIQIIKIGRRPFQRVGNSRQTSTRRGGACLPEDAPSTTIFLSRLEIFAGLLAEAADTGRGILLTGAGSRKAVRGALAATHALHDVREVVAINR